MDTGLWEKVSAIRPFGKKFQKTGLFELAKKFIKITVIYRNESFSRVIWEKDDAFSEWKIHTKYFDLAKWTTIWKKNVNLSAIFSAATK